MISIKNINKWYGDFQVLTDCSTEVKKGEVVVVCGPSGSGKSTLIKCVNALEPFQKGDIVVDGTSIADPKTHLPQLRSRVGMVFQHFELFPHPKGCLQVDSRVRVHCDFKHGTGAAALAHAMALAGTNHEARNNVGIHEQFSGGTKHTTAQDGFGLDISNSNC